MLIYYSDHHQYHYYYYDSYSYSYDYHHYSDYYYNCKCYLAQDEFLDGEIVLEGMKQKMKSAAALKTLKETMTCTASP